MTENLGPFYTYDPQAIMDEIDLGTEIRVGDMPDAEFMVTAVERRSDGTVKVTVEDFA